MSRAVFAPNSYQTPTAYIDDVMPLLTPAEWMVVSYLIRRTFASNEPFDEVCVCEADIHAFTPLSFRAVKVAVFELHCYGVIQQVPEQRDAYALQFDKAALDLAGLTTRRHEREDDHDSSSF